LLVLNQPHLEAALTAFVDHYNTHRPHRGLELKPPQPSEERRTSLTSSLEGRVQRRDRLGGALHEYFVAA
jgi:hypothetical protein